MFLISELFINLLYGYRGWHFLADEGDRVTVIIEAAAINIGPATAFVTVSTNSTGIRDPERITYACNKKWWCDFNLLVFV